MSDRHLNHAFMFEDGPKLLANCSWQELREVIDYLTAENEGLRIELGARDRLEAYYQRVDREIVRYERRSPALGVIFLMVAVGLTIYAASLLC